MQHVMIDLETLSSKNTAAIVSIGAVAFDPDTGKLGKEFYCVIDPETCERAGLHISASTFIWWLKQSEQARKALTEGKLTPLVAALQEFYDWWQANEFTFLWGNGSDFDNAILGNAYAAVGLKQPWGYSKNRCFRTLKNIAPKNLSEPLREGTHHNALDDAKHQARWAHKIFKHGACHCA